MALYAIGDLHLAFRAKLKNEEQRTGALWVGREEKMRKNCGLIISLKKQHLLKTLST